MAAETLESGSPGDEAYDQLVGDLDFWLRSDGHRRNPGTSADLLAASLFAALREGIINLPGSVRCAGTREMTKSETRNLGTGSRLCCEEDRKLASLEPVYHSGNSDDRR